jgi:hypothetical protein
MYVLVTWDPSTRAWLLLISLDAATAPTIVASNDKNANRCIIILLEFLANLKDYLLLGV